MYRMINDFAADWEQESASTLQMIHALTDDSLRQKVTPDGRSLGFLAWHIVLSQREMGGRAGLTINAPEEGTPMAARASDIAATYSACAKSVLESVRATWNDAALAEEIDMYGEKWTRGATLNALVKHEIHHRAQMTVLMRQAGLRVPGVYGPAREEWSKMGMTAPA